MIVEASEMAGTNRAEIESLKAFISRQDDGNVRLAYARRPETMLRRCIVVGTTNSKESLPNDVTGLRRFVPVELWGADEAIEDLASVDRERWWAEARDRLAAGERAAMPRELIPAQAEIAEEHRSRNSLLEDAIDKFHADVEVGLHGAGPWTMADIGRHSGLAERRDFERSTKSIGQLLRGKGWDSHRRKQGDEALPVLDAGRLITDRQDEQLCHPATHATTLQDRPLL